MSSSESEEDCYCPALPPHLLQKKFEEDNEEKDEKVEEISTKSSAVIGPSLPPGFSKPSSTIEMTQREEQVDALRVDPSPATTKRSVLYGPVAPQRDNEEGEDYAEGNYKYEEEDEADDDDDDIIGPYPPDHPKAQLGARVGLRLNRVGEDEKLKREEWMLIPPKNKPISGLASRKFLPRSLDTSKHEDDEEDETNEKQDLKEEYQAKLIEKRDELMSNLQSESGSAESLLESHRKNLKKRKLEEAKQGGSSGNPLSERKPFDRETDLKVFKMDADDKNRFIARANTELTGRFSHGKKAGKFL